MQKPRLVSVLVVLAALAGCQFPAIAPHTPSDSPGVVGQAQPAPALQGRIDFGTRLQAGLPDVISGATVSLINIGAAQTVSTALTDAQGNFVLNFSNGYVADPTATYYLEAVKGQGSHAPGQDALRVRTIIRYANGWTSLTNATPNAGIVINPATTALAVAAGLRNGKPAALDFSQFIGSLSGNGQDVYAPVTGISGTDYSAVLQLVADCLAADRDPVAGIGLDLAAGWLALNQRLTVTGLDKTSGPADTTVVLTGTGFDLTASKNRVAFNGVESMADSASPTQISAKVPAGATSGQVTVQVGALVALGPTFTVPVTVAGFAPTSGRAGSSVTLSGSGFSAKLWENAVTFAGVPGTVMRATPTELTVTVPATQTGALAVTVAGQTTAGGTFVYESPMLAALTPAMERPGRVIVLEGNFGPTAMVNFPGGVSVSATGTTNRLLAVVPEGATTGDLTVTTDGVVTRALPFHRMVGNLSLDTFTRWLPQTSTARALPQIPNGRKDHTVQVIGNRLYVIGGRDSASMFGDVLVARIYADGTLSGFTSAGTNLQVPREKHASVVIGSSLYVLGGHDGSTTLASIERAPINPDGTLGTFQNAGSLTTPRQDLTSQVVGNRLHVLGGKASSTLNSVESALIASDGSLSAFQTASGSLVTARSAAASAVVRDHLYVIAGLGGSTPLNTVERARILPDGRLGAFETLASTLVESRQRHLALALGDALYVISGGNSPSSTSESAWIQPDGSLTAFQSLPDAGVPSRLKGSALAIVGNHALIVGGEDDSTTGILRRAALNADPAGAMPRFETVAFTPLPELRKEAPSAVIGDWLYVFAGQTVQKQLLPEVLRARIQRDGTLGAFESTGLTQPSGGQREAVMVLDNHVYLSERLRVAISDGVLSGSFASTGYAWPTSRTSPTVATLGTRIHMMGGSSTVSQFDESQVGLDGSLSQPSVVSHMTGVRWQHLSAVLGNQLYLIGGALSDHQLVGRASIEPRVGSLGSFSSIVTGHNAIGTPEWLKVARTQPAGAVFGNSLYLFGGNAEDSTERLRLRADQTVIERVPFNFMVPNVKRTCHVVGNTLLFVSEHGVESVRVR